MKRLTMKDGKGNVFTVLFSGGDLIDRLADYEDAGLTPKS